MKWTKKTHEFDRIWLDMKINCSQKIKYYLFGAGKSGDEWWSLINLFDDGGVAGYFDNSKSIIGNKKNGCKILDITKYQHKKNNIIIVSVGEKYEKSICTQLEQIGLKRNLDYYAGSEFRDLYFPIILLYYYNILYDDMVQISVTERCTLKCKHCAHTCPYVDYNNKTDLLLNEVKESADAYFSTFDYVNRFTLLGGEPLLYKELTDALIYIGERYRNRIRDFFITTNATVLPKEDLINVCKKYEVGFEISDYRQAVPVISDKVKQFINILKESNVKYRILNDRWIDLGFPYINNSENDAKRIFDLCGAPCHEVRKTRYYSCILARCAAENIYSDEGEEYYVDIANSDDDTRKIVFEFIHGYCDKGYLKLCRHCRGLFGENNIVVPGVQMSKGNEGD